MDRADVRGGKALALAIILAAAVLVVAGCSGGRHEDHGGGHGDIEFDEHGNVELAPSGKETVEEAKACDARPPEHLTVYRCERTDPVDQPETTFYHVELLPDRDEETYHHVVEHIVAVDDTRPIRAYFYENRGAYRAGTINALATIDRDGSYTVAEFGGGWQVRGTAGKEGSA